MKIIEDSLNWLPSFGITRPNHLRATSLKVNNTGLILGAVKTPSGKIEVVLYDEIYKRNN